MKLAVKIIKRKIDETPETPKASEHDRSVEQNTREMVHTIKSWISELQQKKRVQGYSDARRLSWPPPRVVQNS
jgi:hypothetical protein